MGKAVAQLLASKGASVIIVARNLQKLEAALKEISVYSFLARLASFLTANQASALDSSVQKFHFISGDLSDPSEATRVLLEATAFNGNTAPDILFCCAGSAAAGLFVDFPMETLKTQMDINYLSSAYIAHAVVRAWLQHPTIPAPGTKKPEAKQIVFTSSLASFLYLAGYCHYSPSKVALRALADTLSQECLLYEQHTPIRTHTIFPGTIQSPGLIEENKTKHPITKTMEEGEEGQTPEEVAAKSLKGLERGDEMITTSGITGMAMKAGMLGGAKRSGWGVVDTLLSWAVTIVLVFVRREHDGMVRNWGRSHDAGFRQAAKHT